MSRPIKLGDSSMHQIQLTELAKELAQGLTEQGEFFFKGNQVMDILGLAYTTQDTSKAIDYMLSFTKELKKLRCQMKNFGFVEIDRTNLIFAFTYTIESTRFDNEPLWVRENFQLQVPLLALVNETASMWIEAYRKRPQLDIIQVANGK